MVWLRARTNSLNLGENSWQRNRDTCVGCSEERETLEHFILHCPRWEEWRNKGNKDMFVIGNYVGNEIKVVGMGT